MSSACNTLVILLPNGTLELHTIGNPEPEGETLADAMTWHQASAFAREYEPGLYVSLYCWYGSGPYEGQCVCKWEVLNESQNQHRPYYHSLHACGPFASIEDAEVARVDFELRVPVSIGSTSWFEEDEEPEWGEEEQEPVKRVGEHPVYNPHLLATLPIRPPAKEAADVSTR